MAHDDPGTGDWNADGTVQVICLALVVRDGGDVLTCLRTETGPWAGHWEFPGGKLEPGETPVECAVRECREETGLAPEHPRPLTFTWGWDHDAPLLLLAFVGRAPDGAEVRTASGLPHRWLPPAGLRDLRMPPANGPLVDALEQRLHPGG